MKRVFDLCASAIGLIVLAPLMMLLAWKIWRDMGWPILFRQTRPGLHGKPFKLIKFRTMTTNDLPDAERITSLGKSLRATSLDELPELWNVLKGDMSLVGPRPLLMEYLPLYSAQQARRMDVRPGITGWAQINGRNALSWEAKFALDLWYVDNRSFTLDIKILLRTIRKVLARDGITAEGEATMPRFKGTK